MKKIYSSSYYSDKSFVYIGTGILSFLTRFLYTGNTTLGKVFFVFGFVMLFLGFIALYKCKKCKRMEQNCVMTNGFAIYLFNRYIERNVKKCDADTILFIKALKYVIIYLEGQGYKEEEFKTMTLVEDISVTKNANSLKVDNTTTVLNDDVHSEDVSK